MDDGARAAIVARGLVRTFGRVHALDGLDLAVEAGDVVGLLGPNGAGKTTFIRVVAGLLRPTAGAIVVLGRPPGLQVAGELGYMTQSPALYEDLPVRDNIVFFGRLFGLDRGTARARADELIELVALTEKATTPVRDLSGGMRQRTNLACAMVHRPRLLLLDEPTVGVDPELRVGLWRRFAEMHEEGTTILITTHVMEEAARCRRVVMVADGRRIASGTPEELLTATGAGTLEDAYLAFAARAREEASGSRGTGP
ncbi:MAG: ABC transporter ATP-binding protein [Candidatus Velamenicoccus archaeovorus]